MWRKSQIAEFKDLSRDFDNKDLNGNRIFQKFDILLTIKNKYI